MVLFHTWILVSQEICTTSKLKYMHMFWPCELTVTDFELVVFLFHMYLVQILAWRHANLSQVSVCFITYAIKCQFNIPN